MKRQSNVTSKRFARRFTLTIVIALMLIVGAITIAYCAGTDRGAYLYQEEMHKALEEAYQKGYADAKDDTISVGSINGFSLEGNTFNVFIEFAGTIKSYSCEVEDVVRSLPFQ